MLIYLFPVLIFALSWLMLIRPQQRRLRQREALVAAVEVGHRVVTAGGLHGQVVGDHGDVLDVEIAEGVSVRIDRRAVGRVPSLEPIDTAHDAADGATGERS